LPETIALVEPAFDPDELFVVKAALQAHAEPSLEQLEVDVAKHTGQTDAIAASSYEDAAVLLLQASGIGDGDDVVMGALHDARLASAVQRIGASLVVVDVNPSHLGPADAALADAMSTRTRAVIAGSIDGDMRMIDSVASACVRQEVAFIECVGPWLGMQTNGRLAGARGRAALVDLGQGVPHGVDTLGVITTSDDTLAHTCKAMRSLRDGVAPAMPGQVLGAIAAARLARLATIHNTCSDIAEAYIHSLAGQSMLSLPAMVGSADARWARMIVRLDDDLSQAERDEIIGGLARHDIEIAPAIGLWADAPQACPVATLLAARLIALPMHANLQVADAQLIAQTLELMIERATFHR
jgi:dTDP-4-amino-4,6-dideoxygalactose transaminase